ncbi:MAG TPA: serine hydrolase domain-containing protein [Solirubrobacteraceae bacterium]|nr:serine hydrolase domain-containing protein [Solirubrobacteraceae bacterium]
MTGLAERGDSEELAAALRRIRGVDISEARLLAHEMRPSHLDGVNSDRGALDLSASSARSSKVTEALPGLHLHYRLDVDGFTTALNSALRNEVAGYSLRLNERGKRIRAVDWNWAKEPQDTAEGWTTDVRMHVASLSKQITAIAMTKLLDKRGIPANAKIIDYLPAYWSKGPDVDQITFANLMTHTSGLDFGVSSSASDFQFMKAQIAVGTSHLGQFWYQNMNFGLCRILLATINGTIPVDFSLPPLFGLTAFNDIVWDAITLAAYESYAAAHVFTPSGVSGPTLYHAPTDALAYNFPVSGLGWNSGDLTTMAGGAGWHMAVDEVLDVMGAFRRRGTIMSPPKAQAMLDARFGIDWMVSTPAGTYYAKNGFWYDSAGQTEQGVLFYLPHEMEFVLLVNSPVGTPAQFLYSLVAGAYTSNIVAAHDWGAEPESLVGVTETQGS